MRVTVGRDRRARRNAHLGRLGDLSLPQSLHDLLDLHVHRRQVKRLFSRNESLSHHRIQNGAGKRDSPAGLGQEKRRCGPAYHENGAAQFRAQFEVSAYLGAGAEEICACSCHSAWSQDNQQARRLQGAKEIRRHLKPLGVRRGPSQIEPARAERNGPSERERASQTPCCNSLRSGQVSCSGQNVVVVLISIVVALAAASVSTGPRGCFDFIRGRSSEPSLNSIR